MEGRRPVVLIYIISALQQHSLHFTFHFSLITEIIQLREQNLLFQSPLPRNYFLGCIFIVRICLSIWIYFTFCRLAFLFFPLFFQPSVLDKSTWPSPSMLPLVTTGKCSWTSCTATSGDHEKYFMKQRRRRDNQTQGRRNGGKLDREGKK